MPQLLITGGVGHSTVHLYNSVARHPVWHYINTAQGRFEAEVLQDLCFALGVKQEQLLPLEVESLSCGGNASCSKALLDKLGVKVNKVIVVQVGLTAGRPQALLPVEGYPHTPVQHSLHA